MNVRDNNTRPIDVLWQDAPHVAFADLKSEEAQARLSVCQPISGLQEVTRINGIERYAHQSGEALIYVLLFISRRCTSTRMHAQVHPLARKRMCNVRAWYQTPPASR